MQRGDPAGSLDVENRTNGRTARASVRSLCRNVGCAVEIWGADIWVTPPGSTEQRRPDFPTQPVQSLPGSTRQVVGHRVDPRCQSPLLSSAPSSVSRSDGALPTFLRDQGPVLEPTGVFDRACRSGSTRLGRGPRHRTATGVGRSTASRPIEKRVTAGLGRPGTSLASGSSNCACDVCDRSSPRRLWRSPPAAAPAIRANGRYGRRSDGETSDHRTRRTRVPGPVGRSSPGCTPQPVDSATIVVTGIYGDEVARGTTGSDGVVGIDVAPGKLTVVPQPVEGLLGTASTISVIMPGRPCRWWSTTTPGSARHAEQLG